MPPTPFSPSRSLIFQCPLCKMLVPLERFFTSAEGLTLQCPACCEWIACPPTLQSLPYEVSRSGAKDSLPFVEKSSLLGTLPPSSAAGISSATPLPPSDVPEPKTRRTGPPTGEIVLSGVVASDRTGLSCPKCKTPRAEASLSCWRCGLSFANVGVTYQPENLDQPTTPEGQEALLLWQKVLREWDDPAAHETFLLFCSSRQMFDQAAMRYRTEKEKRDPADTIAASRLERVVELAQQHFLSKPEEEERISSTRLIFVAILFAVSSFFFYVILKSFFPK